MLTPEEVAFVLNDCGAAAIFAAGEKAEVMAGLTRAVPTLRRVISFDPAGGDVTLFGDLLTSPPATQQIPRPAPADLSTIGYSARLRCARSGFPDQPAEPAGRATRRGTGR